MEENRANIDNIFVNPSRDNFFERAPVIYNDEKLHDMFTNGRHYGSSYSLKQMAREYDQRKGRLMRMESCNRKDFNQPEDLYTGYGKAIAGYYERM